ncbi:MAG: hypothetical protein QXO30_00290 [Candidatus Caldarchaeum sp.]
MDAVQRFTEAYEQARQSPTDDNILKLLESLLPFSPPGLEWGLEVASIAGITYILEGGRAVAVRVSRDEFGPFMQTSVAEIPVSSIPSSALREVRNVEAFMRRITSHLREWVSRMPAGDSRRTAVETLLRAVSQAGER